MNWCGIVGYGPTGEITGFTALGHPISRCGSCDVPIVLTEFRITHELNHLYHRWLEATVKNEMAEEKTKAFGPVVPSKAEP